MSKGWFVFLSLWFCGISASIAETQSYRLTDFYAGANPVMFQGKSNRVEMAIPKTSVTSMLSARLSLQLVASAALIQERSILVVRFNQVTIGQINLDGKRPQISAQVDIPADLWRDGFNSLSFAVSQHYADRCTDGTAPELWSELNLYDSRLTVEYQNNVSAPKLADLSGVLGPGIGGLTNILLVNAGDAAEVEQQVLPVIAQALALRRQYQPLQIRHSHWLTQPSRPELDEGWNAELEAAYRRSAHYLPASHEGNVHVLTGTKEQLSEVLSENVLADIDGPFLAIQRTPAFYTQQRQYVPSALRLVISGRDFDELSLAARSLSDLDDGLNQTKKITVLERRVENAPSQLSARYLEPGSDYPFVQIGQSEIAFVGADNHQESLQFNLPPDFYVDESTMAKLSLDFGYGAGMGLGSILNVFVNDKLVHGLSLDNPGGQAFSDYQLNIPARLLKGGPNSVVFEATLRAPLAGKECAEVPGSHLVFQLHGSSVLELPEAGRAVMLPDFQLMSKTGYPFAASLAEPQDVNVQIDDPALMGAALTLIGKLSQSAKIPLQSMKIVQGTALETTNNIILATPQSLPDTLFENWNLQVSRTQKWPYQLLNDLRNSRVVEAFNRPLDNISEDQQRLRGYIHQQGDLGDLAIMTATLNSKESRVKGLNTIIVAQHPQILVQRISDLVSLDLWGQLKGDFFAWKDSRAPVLTMQISSRSVMMASDDYWLQLRLWLSTHPWIWFVVLFTLIVLLSVLARVLLKRRNERLKSEWQ